MGCWNEQKIRIEKQKDQKIQRKKIIKFTLKINHFKLLT